MRLLNPNAISFITSNPKPEVLVPGLLEAVVHHQEEMIADLPKWKRTFVPKTIWQVAKGDINR